MPFNKDYLWNLFKHLKTSAKPIFMEEMSEDYKNHPKTYIVIDRQTYDESALHGDGLTLLRNSSFTIRINSISKETAFETSQDYIRVLNDNGIKYINTGTILDPYSGYYTIALEGSVMYHV